MKALALIAFLIPASVIAADDANLLKPTNKTESWNFEQHEGGKGEMKAVDDAIVFTTTEVDGTNWHVQVYQLDLDLKEGAQYVVSFEAKAEKPQSARLEASIGQEDWHGIGLSEELFLTKDYKKQEFTFRASGVAEKKNRIGFMLGDNKGVVSVKNMTLKAK